MEDYGEFLARVGTQAANKYLLLGEGEVAEQLLRMVHQAMVLVNHLQDDKPNNARLEAAADRVRAAWQSTKRPVQPARSAA